MATWKISVREYVYSFQHNTRTWRIDGRTDGWTRHDVISRACSLARLQSRVCQNYRNSESGTFYGSRCECEWKRQRGRPCRMWVQQIEDDTGLSTTPTTPGGSDRTASQAFQWVSEWVWWSSYIFTKNECTSQRHGCLRFGLYITSTMNTRTVCWRP